MAKRKRGRQLRVESSAGGFPNASSEPSYDRSAQVSRDASVAAADVEAEASYRRIIETSLQARQDGPLKQYLEKLAVLLQDQPDRLPELLYLAEQVLTREHATLEPTASWSICRVLAETLNKLANQIGDQSQKPRLQAQAACYRQLYEYAPQFVTALGDCEEFAHPRAVLLGRIGCCFHLAGRPDLAALSIQKALAAVDKAPADEETQGLRAMLLFQCAEALANLDRRSEAKHACEAALKISQELCDVRGQAIGQGKLGNLALLEGNRGEALSRFRASQLSAQQISAPALEAFAQCQMARLLREQRQWGEAEQHYLKAAGLFEACDDLQGAAQLESELAAMRQQSGIYLVATDNTAVGPDQAKIDSPSSSDDSGFEIMIHDHVSTEFVFEPNLLIDGWQEDRISPWSKSQERLAEALHPAMTPRARVYTDDSGAIWIALPQDELRTRPQQGCTFMKRQRREVRVSGDRLLVWDLIRKMDGSSTVGELLSRLRADKRERAANLLAALASCGAVDVSGRAIGRFLHTATKKGVLSAGGLVGDELRKLATDGDYRKHPHAPKLALSPAIPETLQHFRALTRARRSRRDYESAGVKRQDLEAVLDTACGVTGSVHCDGREVKLRAYPSSGALYAVEIYLLVLRVDGFEPGLYHYRAVDNLLEIVKPNLDRKAILGAMLPMERQMVGGAAAMICLTGNFPRHERKYGEGGYRMLVAEAGHISQNVVLAATALGLAARPFGGVFDSTFNAELGVEQDKEEFLLAVLIGRAAKSK